MRESTRKTVRRKEEETHTSDQRKEHLMDKRPRTLNSECKTNYHGNPWVTVGSMNECDSRAGRTMPLREDAMKKTTPLQAIRAFCLVCMGGKDTPEARGEVKACAESTCPFHPYRLGKGRPSVKKIKKVCLFCMGESTRLISQCVSKDCPAHPFRFGKNPNRVGMGQKDAFKEAVSRRKAA
jgi:hypothetical protein